MKFRYRIYPPLELLYDFVHSLNSVEISHFKLSARSNTGVAEDLTYIQFFDILLSIEKYDKKVIKEALHGKSTLKRFTDSKSYLYHRLLNSLPGANPSESSDVGSIVEQVRALVLKGLHQHIPKLVEIGLEIAFGIEDFAGALQILELWKFEAKNSLEGQQLNEELQKIHNLSSQAKVAQIDLLDWEELDSLIFLAKSSPSVEKEKILSRVLQKFALLDQIPHQSIRAKIRSLNLQEKLIGFEQLEEKGRMPILEEVGQLIKTNFRLLANVVEFEIFLYSSYNLGLLATIYLDKDKFDISVSLLEFLSNAKPNARILVIERKIKLEMFWAQMSKDLARVNESVVVAKDCLAKMGAQMTPKIHLQILLQLSTFFFQTGQWSEITKLLVPYLNRSPLVQSSKLISSIWMLYVIAQYEKKNTDIFSSYVKYAITYLRKYDLESPMVTQILLFLRRLSKCSNQLQVTREFEEFQHFVIPALRIKENLYFLRRIPFDKWAEHKLNDKESAFNIFFNAD